MIENYRSYKQSLFGRLLRRFHAVKVELKFDFIGIAYSVIFRPDYP